MLYDQMCEHVHVDDDCDVVADADAGVGVGDGDALCDESLLWVMSHWHAVGCRLDVLHVAIVLFDVVLAGAVAASA